MAQTMSPYEEYKASFPTCQEHKPKGGYRATCLICALEHLSSALSRISYMCEEPNEYQVSTYDVFPDEEIVVSQVKRKLDEFKSNSNGNA